jgi:hypothetical protein
MKQSKDVTLIAQAAANASEAAQTPAGSHSMAMNIGGGGMADVGVMVSLAPGTQVSGGSFFAFL